MVLLSTPKTGALGALPPAAVSNIATAGGFVALLFWFRTWILHVLDVALAWCRGMPRLRAKNAYLQGAGLLQQPFSACAGVGSLLQLLTPVTCFMAGLYAPTSEEHGDQDLPVRGDMPPSMNGVYVRVGPVSCLDMTSAQWSSDAVATANRGSRKCK